MHCSTCPKPALCERKSLCAFRPTPPQYFYTGPHGHGKFPYKICIGQDTVGRVREEHDADIIVTRLNKEDN